MASSAASMHRELGGFGLAATSGGLLRQPPGLFPAGDAGYGACPALGQQRASRADAAAGAPPRTGPGAGFVEGRGMLGAPRVGPPAGRCPTRQRHRRPRGPRPLEAAARCPGPAPRAVRAPPRCAAARRSDSLVWTALLRPEEGRTRKALPGQHLAPEARVPGRRLPDHHGRQSRQARERALIRTPPPAPPPPSEQRCRTPTPGIWEGRSSARSAASRSWHVR